MKAWVRVELDLDQSTYSLQSQPSDMPTATVVGLLFAVLVDLKQKFDEAPALNPKDAEAWQLLGRLESRSIAPQQALNRAITLHLMKRHPDRNAPILLGLDGMLSWHAQQHETDVSVEHAHHGGDVTLEVKSMSLAVPPEIVADAYRVLETGRSMLESG